MANHVVTNVRFDRISDQGKEKLSELFSRIRPRDSKHSYMWFGDMWVDGQEGSPTYEETEQYVWTTDKIGPKWCYFDEIGDDYFRTESAWRYPEDGLIWLFQQLAEVDNSFIASVTYEDEGLNFIGAVVFDSDGIYEYREWEYDEIKDNFVQKFPEFKDKMTEDDDFTEDGWDFWWDNVYEMIYEDMDTFNREMVEYILNEEKNNED